MEFLKNLNQNKNAINFIKDFSYTKDIIDICLFMQFFLIVAFIIFKRSNIWIATLLYLSTVTIFTLFKNRLEEKEKLKCFFEIKLSSILFVAACINHGCFKWMYIPLIKLSASNDQIPVSPSLSVVMALLISLVTTACMIFYSRQDNAILFFEKYLETDFLDKIGFDLDAHELEPGDIALCTSLTTGKTTYLRVKDRFLHMLILGPTGSGKTSQTIIPMINQDMQNLKAGITVIEPKGDLAEKVYAMAQNYGRTATYFNPVLDACPSFNPLYGKEEDVVENITTTFKMLNPDSSQYFQDMNEQLLRNALSLLKRLKGNEATLIDLHRLISNVGGEGRKMVNNFSKLPARDAAIAKQNEDIANYFLGDYLAERSKTYENCSGVRSQVSKLISNKFLREVLNPTDGGSDIDFSAHLANGGVIAITTAQGKLRDLGKYLGYFIILNFQSAVFKRPGNEDTRRHHFLYIDEFQVYTNPGFADMLTQGRSYRVASHLATQNRALIGMGAGSDGDSFVELVSTNARNIIIYPGGNYADAKFYSDQFGKILQRTEQKGITRKKWSPIYMSESIGMPSESIRVTEEYIERFRPDEIIYKQFGEITFAIIENNSLKIPDVGKISYIPYELNKKLNKMVFENTILMMKGMDPNEYRDLENGGELKPIVYEMMDMEKYLEAIQSDTFDDDYFDKEDMSEEEFSKQMDDIKQSIGIDTSDDEEDFDMKDAVVNNPILEGLDLTEESKNEESSSGDSDIIGNIDFSSFIDI